ncbi:class I SAM-dependent methyltransferase [Streptococcus sp. NLN76]|uniref:class I SAM-dependent methyltransferase n=1 Tax=Streptococcus sp. NLN76 TaxID=2822800 RepID=UPI0018AAB7F6|nr:class I SAM-dependent methyltransferase [Streptococcus sp. NLN76]MBF8970483.1 class I SAM-dependent methyltransferase [Streptococcus sp. NLN76]
MSKMYFERQPDAAHDVRELRVSLLGTDFRFLADAGVFSKKQVDYGSRVLLDSLDFVPGGSLLDVGCGYGPLGITLAKVQGQTVTMVDVNERALDLAIKNAQANGVEASVFASDVYDQVVGTFTHIISNPPIRAGKSVVHRIIEEAPAYLESGGDLTLVIQKKQGAPSAKKKMEEIFGHCDIIRKDKGYYILRSVKE